MDVVERQFESVKARYPEARIEDRADGSRILTIPDVRLPSGWSHDTTTVTIVLPVGYPLARPDTFYTDPDLRLANGGMPANTALADQHRLGHPRLWFSYHPSAWNPNVDTLLHYANFVRSRLADIR